MFGTYRRCKLRLSKAKSRPKAEIRFHSRVSATPVPFSAGAPSYNTHIPAVVNTSFNLSGRYFPQFTANGIVIFVTNTPHSDDKSDVAQPLDTIINSNSIVNHLSVHRGILDFPERVEEAKERFLLQL